MRTGNVRVPAKSDATYLERAAYISFLRSTTLRSARTINNMSKSLPYWSPPVYGIYFHTEAFAVLRCELNQL